MTLRLIRDNDWIPPHRETDADRRHRYGWSPFVICSWCGDTGILPDTKMECHCAIGVQKYEMGQREFKWQAAVPRRFQDYTLAGHPNRHLADQVGQWVDQQPNGENLILQGSVGTGKTGAAIGALRELHFQGAKVFYWSLPDLLDQIRLEEFNKEDPTRAKPTVPQLTECDLLLLDDMGSERTHTEYVTEKIYMIVNNRYVANRPTIITTNHLGKKFEEYLGSRVISRINECARIIRADGPDLRRPR